MVRRQFTHEDLEMALVFRFAGFQKILYQLEHRDDVAALLGMLLIGRQELSQHQDDGSQQTFCGIIEEGVLTTATVISVRIDASLGQDLGILLGLCTGCQIFRPFRAMSM